MARSFGADADRYDRARPRYPTEVIDRIVAALPGPDVLDVGTGTGIAALQLADAGCRVVGVEVDPHMAEVARRAGVPVEVAAFEQWDAAGRTYDGVTAAQAWHWVDPPAGTAKAAGVLRPGGLLAALWNIAQPEPEVAATFRAVYERLDPPLPFNPWARPPLDAYAPILDRTSAAIRAHDRFGEPQRWEATWPQTSTKEAWLDQVPTFGGHSRLPPTALATLVAGLGDAIDAAGGALELTYTTVVVSASRT